MGKLIPLSLLTLSTLSANIGAAQQPPRLPIFPLPTKFIPEAPWPQKDWPPAMRLAIRQTFQCTSCRSVVVSRVSLGALGTAAILDQSDDPCEAQAGNCANLTIMYRFHGKYQLQDITGSGYANIIPSTGSVPDIIGVSDFPCCSGYATRYSYSLSQQKFVESGCDIIDYDKFGDFKGAEVTPCN